MTFPHFWSERQYARRQRDCDLRFDSANRPIPNRQGKSAIFRSDNWPPSAPLRNLDLTSAPHIMYQSPPISVSANVPARSATSLRRGCVADMMYTARTSPFGSFHPKSDDTSCDIPKPFVGFRRPSPKSDDTSYDINFSICVVFRHDAARSMVRYGNHWRCSCIHRIIISIRDTTSMATAAATAQPSSSDWRLWNACCDGGDVRPILAVGADITFTTPKSEMSALMAAAYYNQPQNVKALLDARADPSHTAREGMWRNKTALQIAEAKGHQACVELLSSR
eukprot:6211050-Pleurochrysis_carterae.AAC.3